MHICKTLVFLLCLYSLYDVLDSIQFYFSDYVHGFIIKTKQKCIWHLLALSHMSKMPFILESNGSDIWFTTKIPSLRLQSTKYICNYPYIYEQICTQQMLLSLYGKW